MESFLWVGFVSGNFVVPDEVEVNLAEVKDKGDIFGGGLYPLFDFGSFLFFCFGQTLNAFALHFDVEGIFSMQEHVNEGISECEVIDASEIGLVVFDGVLEFGHVGSVGLRVEVGFREGLFGRGLFSHIKERDN